MKRVSVMILVIICWMLIHPALSPYRPSHFLQTAAFAAGQNDKACGDPTFEVENQAETSASLSIIEASCDGAHFWKARIELRNTSDKAIRGYEVAHIETYEHKKDVRTTEGVTGIELKPSESVILPMKAGFRDGLSYGKPVGRLQKVAFRFEQVEFADGTTWKRNK